MQLLTVDEILVIDNKSNSNSMQLHALNYAEISHSVLAVSFNLSCCILLLIYPSIQKTYDILLINIAVSGLLQGLQSILNSYAYFSKQLNKSSVEIVNFFAHKLVIYGYICAFALFSILQCQISMFARGSRAVSVRKSLLLIMAEWVICAIFAACCTLIKYWPSTAKWYDQTIYVELTTMASALILIAITYLAILCRKRCNSQWQAEMSSTVTFSEATADNSRSRSSVSRGSNSSATSSIMQYYPALTTDNGRLRRLSAFNIAHRRSLQQTSLRSSIRTGMKRQIELLHTRPSPSESIRSCMAKTQTTTTSSTSNMQRLSITDAISSFPLQQISIRKSSKPNNVLAYNRHTTRSSSNNHCITLIIIGIFLTTCIQYLTFYTLKNRKELKAYMLVINVMFETLSIVNPVIILTALFRNDVQVLKSLKK